MQLKRTTIVCLVDCEKTSGELEHTRDSLNNAVHAFRVTQQLKRCQISVIYFCYYTIKRRERERKGEEKEW